MDTIIISDLEVYYHVGVTEAERATAQRLLLTVEMGADFTAAVKNDDVSQTINYDTVSRRLLRFGDGRHWQLLETLAVEMAEMVLKDFQANTVLVEVKKFIIPQARHVGVRVRRPAQA